MQQIGDAPRMLVWDAVGEWSKSGAFIRVRTLRDLHALIVADIQQPGPFRVAYCGPMDRKHFESFCKMAWAWLKRTAGVCIVEELSDVTAPNKASGAWGTMVRQHRHAEGSAIFGLTQRPAETDKTIVGNCTAIHSGRMNFESDRLYVAACLDVPVEEIRKLPPLAWIERNMATLELTRGAIVFR